LFFVKLFDCLKPVFYVALILIIFSLNVIGYEKNRVNIFIFNKGKVQSISTEIYVNSSNLTVSKKYIDIVKKEKEGL
jgi:hypothetical protein